MGVNIYHVKDVEKYWERLDQALQILISTLLRDRYEYGINAMCSESGIQRVLVQYAEKIARKQKVKINKTRCICMAAGLCFPEYGSVGLAALKEYMKEKQLHIDSETLYVEAIERKISLSAAAVTPELDEALRMYYSNACDDPEVNIARFCQIKLKEARNLMKKGVFAGEALTQVMEPALKEYSEKGEYFLEYHEITIPEEIRSEIFKSAEEAIGFCGSEGIYEMF